MIFDCFIITGAVLLDLEAEDLNSIVTRIVEQMVTEDLLKPEMKGKVMWTLLLKHRSDSTSYTRLLFHAISC